jgi:DNA-binding ferritin-like protein
VALALSYVLVRLMNALHGKTETYATKLQQVTHTVNERTQEYSEKSIQPVLAAKKQSARVRQTVRSFFGRSG